MASASAVASILCIVAVWMIATIRPDNILDDVIDAAMDESHHDVDHGDPDLIEHGDSDFDYHDHD